MTIPIAEQIAILMGDDGKDYSAWIWLASEHPETCEKPGDVVEYTFADGSAIVDAGAFWYVKGEVDESVLEEVYPQEGNDQ